MGPVASQNRMRARGGTIALSPHRADTRLVARLLAAGGLTVGIAVLSAGHRPSGGCALTRQEPTGT